MGVDIRGKMKSLEVLDLEKCANGRENRSGNGKMRHWRENDWRSIENTRRVDIRWKKRSL